MTRPRLKTSNARWKSPAILIALLLMTLSASGCVGTTRGPILIAPETAFCARYFDDAHPPVWIYESDSETEKSEKTDLLILWERECEIGPEG